MSFSVYFHSGLYKLLNPFQAQASHGKINFLKNITLDERKKLLDTQKQIRQMIEEINESLEALYQDHERELTVKDQVGGFLSNLEYWLGIVTEVLALLSSQLREKELVKIDVIIRSDPKTRKNAKISQCIDISENYNLCRQLRTHAAQMNRISDLITQDRVCK